MYVYIHTVRQELAFLRPPDIVVGGLRFYCDSSSFFFFIRQLSSELAGRNSTKTGHMLGSGCDLRMYYEAKASVPGASNKLSE